MYLHSCYIQNYSTVVSTYLQVHSLRSALLCFPRGGLEGACCSVVSGWWLGREQKLQDAGLGSVSGCPVASLIHTTVPMLPLKRG